MDSQKLHRDGGNTGFNFHSKVENEITKREKNINIHTGMDAKN